MKKNRKKSRKKEITKFHLYDTVTVLGIAIIVAVVCLTLLNKIDSPIFLTNKLGGERVAKVGEVYSIIQKKLTNYSQSRERNGIVFPVYIQR